MLLDLLPPLCGNGTKGSLKTKRQLLQSRWWIRRDPLRARLFADLSDNFQVSSLREEEKKSSTGLLLATLRNNPHLKKKKKKVRSALPRPYSCAIKPEYFKLYKTGDLPRRTQRQTQAGVWRTVGETASTSKDKDALPCCPFTIKAFRARVCSRNDFQIKVCACKKRCKPTKCAIK